ncbi:hypothetical protein H311_02984 [Anncaliia algerae PRA109]|nr:hypothetical protein H311_02984 [Anncaliia algerae PRA109]
MVTFLNAFDKLKNKIEKSFNTTIESKDMTFPDYVILLLEKNTQISKIIIDREFFVCNETNLILSNALIFNSEIKRCEFYSFLRLSKNNYARLQELSCKCNKSYVSFLMFKKESK